MPEITAGKLQFSDFDLIYLGPRCDYHPEKPRTPTGFTWPELEAYRLQSPRYTHTLLAGRELDRILRALKLQAQKRVKNNKYEENYLKLIQSPVPIKDPSIKTTNAVALPIDLFETDLITELI